MATYPIRSLLSARAPFSLPSSCFLPTTTATWSAWQLSSYTHTPRPRGRASSSTHPPLPPLPTIPPLSLLLCHPTRPFLPPPPPPQAMSPTTSQHPHLHLQGPHTALLPHGVLVSQAPSPIVAPNQVPSVVSVSRHYQSPAAMRRRATTPPSSSTMTKQCPARATTSSPCPPR